MVTETGEAAAMLRGGYTSDTRCRRRRARRTQVYRMACRRTVLPHELLQMRPLPEARRIVPVLRLQDLVPERAESHSTAELALDTLTCWRCRHQLPATPTRRLLRETCVSQDTLLTPPTPIPSSDRPTGTLARVVPTEAVAVHREEEADEGACYPHLDMRREKTSIDVSDIEKVWTPLRNALASSLPDDMLYAITGPTAWKSACSQVSVMMKQAAQSLPESVREWLLARVDAEAETLLTVAQREHGQRILSMWRDMPEAERSSWEAQAVIEKTEYEKQAWEWRQGLLQHEPKRPRSAYFLWANTIRAQKKFRDA